MPSLRSFRWWWFYFLFGQCARSDWPSSNSSSIQLLGLFSDIIDTPSLHSRAMFKAAMILSQQYNITVEGQFIGWHIAQSKDDVMSTLSNTCLLISTSNIVGIVGPGLSRESHFIAPFAAKIGIPVISYSSTDPELSARSVYAAFYRTIPSDNAAALALVNLFIHFNWTSCIIIYQNDAFWFSGVKVISEAFANNKLKVTETIVFDIITLSIRDNLKSLLTQSSTRIVLVWAAPSYTTLILQHALDSDVVGPHFTWILSVDIPLTSFNETLHDKLNGMLFVTPVVGGAVNAPTNKTLLNAAYQIWQQYEPESFPGSDEVDYLALFAFDATWTLIQALEQFCSIMPDASSSSSCLSLKNTSFCFDRKLLNSTSLFNIINNRTFLGVSGPVKFSPNVTDRMNGTYYIVKNVQRLLNSLNKVPVLVWSESDSWISLTQSSVIVWPGNTLKTPSDHVALSGVILRIAVIEAPPFTMETEIIDKSGQLKKQMIGYVPDLIELLQNRMGFIPHIVLVSSNETYNGLVDAIINGVYDLVVADLTITAERREKVAFSSSIFDNSVRIVVRETSNTDVDLLLYLRPFSFKVWITLLIVSLYAGFLICLLEREHNEALRGKSILPLIAKSVWYSIGTILGYGSDFHVRTAAGRLLTIGIYILSLVSISAYTAKLASDLTIAKTKQIISGLDDLKNGKLSFNRIGVLANSSLEDYYLREISGNNRNFHPLSSDSEIYDKLLNDIIDAAITDSGIAEYWTNNVYCNLTLTGLDFNKNAFGIVFQKAWHYQQLLDVNILLLRELGVLDNLKQKWFQTNRCFRSSETSASMSIESMAGIFVTFAIISFLSILLFIWIKRFIIRDYFLRLRRRNNS